MEVIQRNGIILVVRIGTMITRTRPDLLSSESVLDAAKYSRDGRNPGNVFCRVETWMSFLWIANQAEADLVSNKAQLRVQFILCDVLTESCTSKLGIPPQLAIVKEAKEVV